MWSCGLGMGEDRPKWPNAYKHTDFLDTVFFTKVFPWCHLFKEQLLYITREANIWIIKLSLGSFDMELRQPQAKEPFLCVGQICPILYFDTEYATSI